MGGLYLIGGVVAVVMYFAMVESGVTRRVNRVMNVKLEEFERKKSLALADIDRHRALVTQMRAEFEKSYAGGRRWLIGLIVEAFAAQDEAVARNLERKSRPAHKAADEVRRVKAEKRALAERGKHFEYLLKTLYEDYPVLGDYEEDILDDKATLSLGVDDSPDTDLVATFISEEDYRRLKPVERNQLALERWIARKKSNVEIGRLYERYIGSRYESRGWIVQYHGATQGLEDLGRDLICKKASKVQIVQAKYWSSHKTIHEKHVFQLYGTTFLYARGAGKDRSVRGILCCTSKVSDTAREVANALAISLVEVPMEEKNYPMIKCNVNGKDKIYHLPFDQQYDRVRIGTRVCENSWSSFSACHFQARRRDFAQIARLRRPSARDFAARNAGSRQFPSRALHGSEALTTCRHFEAVDWH
jgi:hypothetical protein